MNSDTVKNIINILSRLDFSKAEISCLLCLGKESPADTKKVSQNTANTYNMTKIMLQNLEKRGLVRLSDTEDQDTYEFTGLEKLNQYLEKERVQKNDLYDQAQAQLGDYLK